MTLRILQLHDCKASSITELPAPPQRAGVSTPTGKRLDQSVVRQRSGARGPWGPGDTLRF
eukprot:CAMPEP_0206274636 /NCGR_PEP_ID=MMETSP0047_2-20121206/35268_1 /ASSEMBLY_ACC=CAM_ASM_000192 /TAXON_ID=195065 /ORGANISM="Chroomonas mesostigmatica_cf, Strain CCMP1168" /LENGTH=59 /DNA_ID=CAMNT_0053703879 /DNA_START=93 /DNA_END=269 /DNA_ORIENTATION=-